MWYRDDVKPAAFPDEYTVIDRNIRGPRGRYGGFSFAAPLRVPRQTMPSIRTMIGAMYVDPEYKAKKGYPLQAAFAKIAPEVFLELKPYIDSRASINCTSGF